MLDDVHRRRRRRVALRGAVMLGAACAIHPAGAAATPPLAVTGAPEQVTGVAAGGCAGAGATLSTASARRLRAAVMCLVNRRRAAHGAGRLRRDRRLVRAAGRHASDMRRRGYFAHQRPGGPSLLARLRRAGWAGTAWGEVIAYGCGSGASPRSIFRSWMSSPGHRAMLLSRTYGRAGVGVAAGAPCGRGAVWAMDLGRGG